MSSPRFSSRRRFLKATVVGAAGVAAGTSWNRVLGGPALVEPAARTSSVALTTGTDRAAVAFEGLRCFEKPIAAAIGRRRVVIKPNNVAIDRPLCATHVDTLEGILEFLKSIKKLDNVVIAESAASGPTLEGFANYGYPRLIAKFPGVQLMDLDANTIETLHVFDEKDFRPHPVRTSSLLLSRDNFIISAARMKTHDRIVATLSLKNIVFGAPIKDAGFGWGRDRKPGAQNDKPIAHGSGFRAINYNLFALASRLRPDLAVIDGVEGMQGNGPVGGTPVDHQVCVVSPDWLAADRVAVELMGIDFAQVGYLNYCAQGGMGTADLDSIEVLGPRISDHIRPYELHRNIEQQLVWQQPA